MLVQMNLKVGANEKLGGTNRTRVEGSFGIGCTEGITDQRMLLPVANNPGTFPANPQHGYGRVTLAFIQLRSVKHLIHKSSMSRIYLFQKLPLVIRRFLPINSEGVNPLHVVPHRPQGVIQRLFRFIRLPEVVVCRPYTGQLLFRPN